MSDLPTFLHTSFTEFKTLTAPFLLQVDPDDFCTAFDGDVNPETSDRARNVVRTILFISNHSRLALLLPYIHSYLAYKLAWSN